MRKEKYTSVFLTKREDSSHFDLTNIRLYWIGFYFCFSNELNELNELNEMNVCFCFFGNSFYILEMNVEVSFQKQYSSRFGRYYLPLFP